MKYLILSITIFFWTYTTVFALERNDTISYGNTIQNAHFTLSNIHELGYEVTKLQNIGLRNSYELESFYDGCTLKISTFTLSRNTTKQEDAYLSDAWLLPPKITYNRNNNWKMSYYGQAMKKFFSHASGIEALSEGYNDWACHQKATKLIRKMEVNSWSVLEGQASSSLAFTQGVYDAWRYFVGADIDSTFLIDFSEGFLWVVSDHPQYWLWWVMLKDSLSNGEKIDDFAGSGMTKIGNWEITYIVLSSVENGKKVFNTFYVFPEEEVWWIIISSKTNNPRENLKSFLSVIQIQNDKQLSKAQKLPTLQEILEQEHILSK